MALSATIYKFTISLSDLNRDYYSTLNLTVAQHPSENVERMMARVLGFCLHAGEGLEFTKGLSTPEAPDIWLKTLDGQIAQWIVVGEPNPDSIKKATRQAGGVWVYTFNSKSDTWWEQSKKKCSSLAVNVIQFPWAELQNLSTSVSRTMSFAVTIADDSFHVAMEDNTCEVSWKVLQGE